METYIALLRGINVGGKNIVSMPILRAAFEEAGFSAVRTYINSGNVFFSATEEGDVAALQQRCEQVIAAEFSLAIPVAVISAADLGEALRHAPTWWDADEDAKHNAIFVIAPASAEDIVREVGEMKPEYEQLAHHGQVLFWSAPIKTFSRTRLSKLVSTALISSITVRNANTAKKLLALSE